MSLTDQVAHLFRARPGEWIDARLILEVGGFGGWRTRISTLRFPPYDMDIKNETTSVQLPDGRWIKRSRYRYLPKAARW